MPNKHVVKKRKKKYKKGHQQFCKLPESFWGIEERSEVLHKGYRALCKRYPHEFDRTTLLHKLKGWSEAAICPKCSSPCSPFRPEVVEAMQWRCGGNNCHKIISIKSESSLNHCRLNTSQIFSLAYLVANNPRADLQTAIALTGSSKKIKRTYEIFKLFATAGVKRKARSASPSNIDPAIVATRILLKKALKPNQIIQAGDATLNQTVLSSSLEKSV